MIAHLSTRLAGPRRAGTPFVVAALLALAVAGTACPAAAQTGAAPATGPDDPPSVAGGAPPRQTDRAG